MATPQEHELRPVEPRVMPVEKVCSFLTRKIQTFEPPNEEGSRGPEDHDGSASLSRRSKRRAQVLRRRSGGKQAFGRCRF